ncbi:hypothetical protein Hanom_Chr14g01284501 [Helianthus anomalus]
MNRNGSKKTLPQCHLPSQVLPCVLHDQAPLCYNNLHSFASAESHYKRKHRCPSLDHFGMRPI